MKPENFKLYFKKRKGDNNPLGSFINAIYDNLFRRLKVLEDAMEREKDPLHYLLLKVQHDAVQQNFRDFEEAVEISTEHRVKVKETED